MGYFGSKATSGLCQPLIAMMPAHDIYIETHLGGGAIMKRKPAALRNIAIDRDARALDAFECGYPVVHIEALVARSLRRHRSNVLSANRCAAQNSPRLRPARSNRSTSSRHCAAVRRARCLVPPVRLMSPLSSVSWGAVSESDGTPDQNNGLFWPLTDVHPHAQAFLDLEAE